MDVAPESIIVVIGHPIAGNPSQFAIERALQSMALDWRVFSLDVHPDDVGIALDGFSVTGITGVLIDRTLGHAAAKWYRNTTDSDFNLESIDCLFRDCDESNRPKPFTGSDRQRQWLDEQIDHFLPTDSTSETEEHGIWFGESLQATAVNPDRFQSEPSFLLTDIDSIKESKLIALTPGLIGPVELEPEDLPENDGSTLVIDLSSDGFSGDHPESDTIAKLGYRVITVTDQKVAVLERCLQRWTGMEVNDDVIRDAIEEYLGV